MVKTLSRYNLTIKLSSLTCIYIYIQRLMSSHVMRCQVEFWGCFWSAILDGCLRCLSSVCVLRSFALTLYGHTCSRLCTLVGGPYISQPAPVAGRQSNNLTNNKQQIHKRIYKHCIHNKHIKKQTCINA